MSRLGGTSAVSTSYRLLSGRGLAAPLAICAGALALLPLASGLPVPLLSRQSVPVPSAQAATRFSHEVYVPDLARGCRWQHVAQPDVQVADCGDDRELIRVVFERGRVTEYRLLPRQDPSRVQPPAPPAPTVSAQQPSQPGRLVPTAH